ncbi:threonine synthase [Nocardia caishijiensis]|uniref:Threonine synthase n=1 Tax=Nocardia caishijiensis TaxID=184756 RepID=A0ABQ6YLQ3_9NOCA|nr:pyridoxal-phosphate dependent enzyme [Nocardia caishijiensis]KAF0846715.1 threonine synthase [Nocardia caishijiensis]
MYRDPVDGSEYRLNEPRWRSAAGRPLWIDPGPGIDRSDIDVSVQSLWRYRAALPVPISHPISLGEGSTPLLEREWAHGGRPLFKLDFLNPTGSFKDRGTSVMLSYLRDRGIRSVLEDSSGNGGSSIAGYGAAGGVRVKVFAPASTSSAKIAQVRAYGAELQLVEGPREESQNEAIRQSDGDAFYASHNWQAFFLQGTKTLAYELWEDLGFRVPDNVIVPVGAGSSLLGCWLGFGELLRARQIERMPRLFAAQPLNCSPVDASFTEGTDQLVERAVSPTIAQGTSIPRPLRLAQMIGGPARHRWRDDRCPRERHRGRTRRVVLDRAVRRTDQCVRRCRVFGPVALRAHRRSGGNRCPPYGFGIEGRAHGRRPAGRDPRVTGSVHGALLELLPS